MLNLKAIAISLVTIAMMLFFFGIPVYAWLTGKDFWPGIALFAAGAFMLFMVARAMLQDMEDERQWSRASIKVLP